MEFKQVKKTSAAILYNKVCSLYVYYSILKLLRHKCFPINFAKVSE